MIGVAQPNDPVAQAYAAYEQLEGKLSTAMDSLVATNGFAELFTTSATNVMALVRMANGAVDQAVKVTRLAAKEDLVGLARQLARTEDKIERLLQLVESLEARLAALEAAGQAPSTEPASAPAPGPAPTGDAAPAKARRPAPRTTKPVVAEAEIATPKSVAAANGTTPRRRRTSATATASTR